MRVYVDTNVIIARYMEEDELKQSADALLGRRGLDLLGSPLTVWWSLPRSCRGSGYA